MEGRSVRPRWLAAAGVSAVLWVSSWLGPPALAQTFDEAQLAGIRQILSGQGFEPVDDGGKDPDPELPECLPFVSSKVGPERAAGYGIRSGIGTLPAPGLIDTDVTVLVWSRDGIVCGQAIAKRQNAMVSGDRKLIPASPPETFAIGGMPAAVGIDSMHSKLVATIGGVAGYLRGSARGTFACGNVEVDVLQSRLASTPTATQADRDTLATAAKADVSQTLRSLGQALVDGNLCSGSYPVTPGATPTARASIVAGSLAVSVGCMYDRPGEQITCTALPTGLPPGTTPTFAWTVDGQPQDGSRAFIDIPVPRDVTHGSHVVAVRVTDPTSGASADGSTTVTFGEAGPLEISVGCTYDRVDEQITCLATPKDAAVGATLAYRWKVDGQPQAETGRFLDIPVRREETNGTHVVRVQASDPASGATSPEVSTTIAFGEGPAGPSIEVVLFGAGVGLIVLVALTGAAVRSGRLGGGKGGQGAKGGERPSEPDVGESVMEALHASASPSDVFDSTTAPDSPDPGPDRPPMPPAAG